MPKEMKVDVKKSLGYQANGRTKKEKVEKAALSVKSFWCPNCHRFEEASKNQFGDDIKCKKCGTVMLQQY